MNRGNSQAPSVVRARGEVGALVAFFVLTFGVTWIAELPMVLMLRGLIAPTPLGPAGAAIGAFGPAIAAVILARRDGGFRSLLAPSGRRLFPWLPIALVVPAALHLIPALLLSGVTGPEVRQVYYPLTTEQIGIMVLSPLGEELGWRGYAQRRLGARMPALKASLIIGVFWALWHLPAMWAAPVPFETNLIVLVFVVGLSPLFAFLFDKSGGSVLVAIVAHLGIHFDNVSRSGNLALPVTCVATWAVVLVLALRQRGSASLR